MLLKLSRDSGKRNKKARFRGDFCHLQNFIYFGNFETDFGFNLKDIFQINYQYIRTYATFWLNLQNRFEACRYNAVTSRLLVNMYPQLHKVLLANSEGILSNSGLKKSYFTLQKHVIIWKMSLTHKY